MHFQYGCTMIAWVITTLLFQIFKQLVVDNDMPSKWCRDKALM